jgi:UDP-glucose 4-epimerase
MSKIFITGVAGFLGSHLADAMLANGHTVVGIDNMIGGDLDNVPSEVEFHQIDCNDFSTVKELMKGCDILYHCAATAYEGLSVFSPHVVTQNIVGASVSVITAAISNSVKRIVICSSMARYGALTPPFKENMTCHPQDPYGIGKLAVEQILINLCDTHGVEYVIAVPHNIIGPRQKYDDPYRNVASIMLNLNLQNRPVVIYGDGQQQRCFSYINDCIQCLEKMAFDPGVVGHVINIGPDEEPVAISHLAGLIANLTRFNGPPIFMPGRPQEVKVALCSSDKVRRLLGYETKTTLENGLRTMMEYIQDRGTKPFKYHLDLEIISDKTPKTWKDRLF